MTTKDYCLSLKDKQDDLVGETFENQVKNLNLNQNHKFFSVDTIQSKSITKTDNKKSLNNDFIDFCAKKNPNLWNYGGNKKFPSNFLSAQNICDKKELKEGKHSSANSSTLSLHIAAYENSIENSPNEFCENSKIKNEKLSLVKRWETAKQSMIQNPFEFPRQQERQNIEPEIMQFKASQKLLNPNFSETELLYWIFENSQFIYSLLGLFIGTIYALTSCGRNDRLPRRNNDPEAHQLRREIYGRASEKERDKLGSERVRQQKIERSPSQLDFAKGDDDNDFRSAKEKHPENDYKSAKEAYDEPGPKKVQSKREKDSSSSRRRRASKREGSRERADRDDKKVHPLFVSPSDQRKQSSRREKIRSSREELNVDRTQESDKESPRDFKSSPKSLGTPRSHRKKSSRKTVDKSIAPTQDNDGSKSKRGRNADYEDPTQRSSSDRVSRSRIRGIDSATSPANDYRKQGSSSKKEKSRQISKTQDALTVERTQDIDRSSKGENGTSREKKKTKQSQYDELRKVRRSVGKRIQSPSRTQTETEKTEDLSTESPFGSRGTKTRKASASQKKRKSNSTQKTADTTQATAAAATTQNYTKSEAETAKSLETNSPKKSENSDKIQKKSKTTEVLPNEKQTTKVTQEEDNPQSDKSLKNVKTVETQKSKTKTAVDDEDDGTRAEKKQSASPSKKSSKKAENSDSSKNDSSKKKNVKSATKISKTQEETKDLEDTRKARVERHSLHSAATQNETQVTQHPSSTTKTFQKDSKTSKDITAKSDVSTKSPAVKSTPSDASSSGNEVSKKKSGKKHKKIARKVSPSNIAAKDSIDVRIKSENMKSVEVTSSAAPSPLTTSPSTAAVVPSPSSKDKKEKKRSGNRAKTEDADASSKSSKSSKMSILKKKITKNIMKSPNQKKDDSNKSTKSKKDKSKRN